MRNFKRCHKYFPASNVHVFFNNFQLRFKKKKQQGPRNARRPRATAKKSTKSNGMYRMFDRHECLVKKILQLPTRRVFHKAGAFLYCFFTFSSFYATVRYIRVLSKMAVTCDTKNMQQITLFYPFRRLENCFLDYTDDYFHIFIFVP